MKALALGIIISGAPATGYADSPLTIAGPEVAVMAAGDPSTYVDNPLLTESYLTASPPLSQATVAGASASFVVNFRGPGNAGGCQGTPLTWPAAAQTAFQYAADIWGGVINSLQPIVVDACWRSLGAGRLGSAGPQLTANRPGLPIFGTWYPFGLADALGNTDFTPGTWDIRANFNDDFTNWYFGTDGITPSGQYDFVTVVLHELGHGLGFSGGASYNEATGTGTLNLQGLGLPTIYSRFTEDGSGTSLWDGYTQGSTNLGSALKGLNGGVFFSGSSAIAGNGGNAVQLYTPSTYNPGSSYSHFAEVFNGGADDLMTYSIGPGNSQHIIGPTTLGVLEDIGWPADRNSTLTRSLGGLSYTPNVPTGALGTLTIDFNFTHADTDAYTNFFLVVNTANSASLTNATSTDNAGGVGSVINIANADLPGGNSLFENSEILTVPMQVALAGGGWGLNFDVFATDQPIAAKIAAGSSAITDAVRVDNFTINSAMIEAQGIVLNDAPTNLLTSSDAVAESVVLGVGCSTGTGGRFDPTLYLLLALALAGVCTRRKSAV